MGHAGAGTAFGTGQKFEYRLTIDDIEAGLDALLSAIEDDACRRLSQQPATSIKATSYSAAEIGKTDPNVWKVRGLIDDPVGRACREQIKLLGKLLFDLVGSTDTMRDTLSRVADRKPEKAGRREVILDKWWNGIGTPGGDMWFA